MLRQAGTNSTTDCVFEGKFVFQIEETRREYGTVHVLIERSELNWQYVGPIVRINPWELHIDDAGYHDRLFLNSGKLEKYRW